MDSSITVRIGQCDLACPDMIVVATDLTDADSLIPHAIAQAKANHAALTFVHVMPPEDIVAAQSISTRPAGDSNLQRNRRRSLENIAKEVRSQGLVCSTVVSCGPISDVVREIITRTGAGRLIIGTHARQGIDRFLLGSVARKLLESIDVPVYIVGPQCKPGSAAESIRNILLATSTFAADGPNTFLTAGIARHCNSSLTLLHVLAPERRPANWLKPGHSITELYRNLPADVDGQPPIFTRVAAGDSATEIVRTANEIRADLIVLGVHYYPFHLPFGKETTAYKVLISAPCPVLTLKSDSALIRKRALTDTRHTVAQ
jgi:nucleotide-binding universal stress UspA family protein